MLTTAMTLDESELLSISRRVNTLPPMKQCTWLLLQQGFTRHDSQDEEKNEDRESDEGQAKP